MRVIAGSARRLQLKCIDGLETRPTTDRIKETLFNIINDDLPGATFIDLFAGSGGIGIEALSRGAARCIFVEKNKRAVACIKENLAHTHFEDSGRVIFGDAVSAVDRLGEYEHLDIIYIDPPYKSDLYGRVLERLALLSNVDEDTLIIIEADKYFDFDFESNMDYTTLRVKDYKNNKHIFVRRNGK